MEYVLKGADFLSRLLPKLTSLLLPAGIRARLFLLIGLVLLPLVLLVGWIYYQRYEILRQREFANQLELAEVVGANFRSYITSIHNQSLIVGKGIISLDLYSQEKAESLLTTASDSYQGIRNMSWVAVDGTVLASSVPGFAGRSLGHRPYFQKARDNGHWAIGDLTQTGTITPAPTIAMATAVHDEIGFLRGLIVVGIEPDRLSEAAMVRVRPGGGYAIFDSKGVVVFRCPFVSLSWEQRTGWIREDHLLERTVKTRRPQVGFAEVASVSPGQWFAARVYIPELGWFAGTGTPAAPVFHAILKDLVQDTFIAMAVCAAAFLLAYLFSRTISEPILHLQRDARQMGQGQIQRLRDPHAPREVQSLREQVEEMATNLIARARQLAEATSELKGKNEELESIISITSHDLKSPVVNIMGFSGELARSLGLLKERLLESHVTECKSEQIMTVLEHDIPEEVNFIQKSTRSIDQMLQSLAKVVNVVLSEIQITRVNVYHVISSIMPEFNERIQKKEIAFTIEPMPDCLADPTLLKEIFFNLIENAITYMVPERPGRVSVGGYVKNEYAIYFVKDNGRGIAPEHQHNIFKLFHRLDISEEGEGIGLTISKRLAERQSGNMWVESKPGRGSTFFVALPKA